jgi:sulfatase modifying factor 1
VGAPASCPPPLAALPEGCAARATRVRIAGGTLHAGAGDWEAEGRVRPHDAVIAPFEMDALEITEQVYGACMAAGRCPSVSLSGEPGRAAFGLTRAEARAVCAFSGGRLPTEDEWTWAAGGANARRYPWGDTGAVCRRAAFGLQDGPCGFGAAGPEIAGSHPDGATPQGLMDLAGNVAEWVEGEAAGSGLGLVRGGSWGSSFAVDLRSWQARAVPADLRSPEVGGRCVYDIGDRAQ